MRAIVDVAFVQLGLDQRRLHVRRDEQAVDGRVGDDVLLQLLQFGDGTRRLERVVVGLGSEAALVVEEDLARRAVGQAGDQVVVHAGQVVDALRRLVDQLQRVVDLGQDHPGLLGGRRARIPGDVAGEVGGVAVDHGLAVAGAGSDVLKVHGMRLLVSENGTTILNAGTPEKSLSSYRP